MIKQHDSDAGIYVLRFRFTFLSRYILLFIPVLACIWTPQRISHPNRTNFRCADPVLSGAVSSNYHVSGVSVVSRQWHQWYIDIGFFENANSENCSEYLQFYGERSVGAKRKVSEHYTEECVKSVFGIERRTGVKTFGRFGKCCRFHPTVNESRDIRKGSLHRFGGVWKDDVYPPTRHPLADLCKGPW